MSRRRRRFVFASPCSTLSGTNNALQMLDLKEKIENEVHAAQDGYLKMEAHIKLYITEMEQTVV